MVEFTADEKRKAALMTQAEADYQIGIMDAIRADYEALAVKESCIAILDRAYYLRALRRGGEHDCGGGVCTSFVVKLRCRD